jgi:hypothetical protein
MHSKKQPFESLNSAQSDGNAKQVLSNAPSSQEAGVHHVHRQEGLHHNPSKQAHVGK